MSLTKELIDMEFSETDIRFLNTMFDFHRVKYINVESIQYFLMDAHEKGLKHYDFLGKVYRERKDKCTSGFNLIKENLSLMLSQEGTGFYFSTNTFENISSFDYAEMWHCIKNGSTAPSSIKLRVINDLLGTVIINYDLNNEVLRKFFVSHFELEIMNNFNSKLVQLQKSMDSAFYSLRKESTCDPKLRKVQECLLEPILNYKQLDMISTSGIFLGEEEIVIRKNVLSEGYAYNYAHYLSDVFPYIADEDIDASTVFSLQVMGYSSAQLFVSAFNHLFFQPANVVTRRLGVII